MRRRTIVGLLALVGAVLFVAGGAGASRVETGGGGYTVGIPAHDDVGPVRVTEVGTVDQGPSKTQTLMTISRFRFANECASGGTLIKGPGLGFVVRHNRFSFRADGVAVTGQVYGFAPSVRGTIAATRPDCDGDEDRGTYGP